ncbi:hypothetical protein LRP30_02805 [Bradyrhizobium sp. C-145]|uniref:hypothetical protein n=1 Tax=Bradyrhizobium sp. C-145 TaxID=574727 RepID=UPI00201B7E24|nr:hypothetical protein [Bradyrhizobium sp. C-145]UQR64268.1 hypothetical protein LRP30_02805 [Bradyrhizobium sp. C-145]
MKKKPDYAAETEFFRDECTKFRGIVQHATTVGNAIGVRDVDEIRGYASWLFVRACVMSKTIENTFNPLPTGFGNAQWLDHASITILCRALIECISVMLYIGDVDIPADEWDCRKRLFILHELVNRTSFLKSIAFKFDTDLKDQQMEYATKMVAENTFFQTLPEKRRKKLLEGNDMYIEGRHEAMLTFEWGDQLTRGMYKYLSNQAHSLPMAFSRTAQNDLYANDSAGAKVTAGFGIEFARKALGRGCVHMLYLFPDTELSIDEIVATALKTTYAPVKRATASTD